MISITWRESWTTGFLLCFLLFPSSLEAQAVVREEVSDQAGIPKGLSFQFKDGLLSVNIWEVPLNQVLRAIAEKAGIEVAFSEPSEEKISLEFTGIPVDQGLKRILKGRGYLLVYENIDPKADLKAVKVYSRDKAVVVKQSRSKRLVLHPSGQPEAGKKFRELAYRALKDTDPAARLEAVEDLGSEEDEKRAAEILALVLEREKDADIRQAALEEMADFDEKGGAALKAAMISLRDPARKIRLEAVEILNDLEAWEKLRQVAKGHPDPKVRKIAAHALDDAG